MGECQKKLLMEPTTTTQARKNAYTVHSKCIVIGLLLSFRRAKNTAYTTSSKFGVFFFGAGHGELDLCLLPTILQSELLSFQVITHFPSLNKNFPICYK